MKNEEKLALIERISKFSGVQDKLLADISYLKGISGTGMQMEKGNPESSFEVNVMNVSTNFFQFMNIPLLSGHTLKAKEDLVVDKTWAERQKKRSVRNYFIQLLGKLYHLRYMWRFYRQCI